MENRFRRTGEVALGSWFRDFLRPRYVSLGVSLFLAMYVGLRFVLVVFNAADVGERWSFELTPFAALNLPDVQLALLAGVAAVSNAFLHYSAERRHRGWAILLTASMVAGLLLALRGASADLDPVNVGRVSVLVLLLGMVSLDHVDLVRSARQAPEDFITSELQLIADRAAAAPTATPAAVTEALQELEALVRGLSEPVRTPTLSEASVGTTDDEYLRELMTSVLGEAAAEDEPPKPATPAARPSPAMAEEELGTVESGPSEDHPGFLRGRLVRSPSVLLEDARTLMLEGKLEKALRRLDRVAAADARFPGLWQLAAEVYDRLGEPEAAAECRRRAAEPPT